MKCPKCMHEDSKVVESRETNLAIVKKNGERELFDRHKLAAAIMRSVGKFLRSDVEVEEIVSVVEDELHGLGMSEIPSKHIGDLVLKELSKRNDVAYVRFASVYRGFSTLDEFEQAIAEAKRARQ